MVVCLTVFTLLTNFHLRSIMTNKTIQTHLFGVEAAAVDEFHYFFEYGISIESGQDCLDEGFVVFDDRFEANFQDEKRAILGNAL